MPMELPAPLAPWSGQLGMFPRDLAIGALGPMLRLLDRLIGPPRLDTRQGNGEPDGFDGLVRRGPYERLLLSEWLLATEAPDEFVRRAATNEHAFYQLVRKTPAGGRLSAALFDAGPDQWGTPRLVQIAVLVILARRAQAAGMRFVWGVAQTTPKPLNVFENITPASIKRLLDVRSPRETTNADVEAWRSLLTSAAQKEKRVDDAWLVGGKRFASLPAAKGASLLVASDMYETEEAEPGQETPRRVAVSVRAAIGDAYAGRAEAMLEVPDPKLCARLLRDPFAVQVGDPVRADRSKFTPASNLVFGAGNVKLFARAADGALISYPVPNSPRAPGGSPKRFGMQGKSLLLAAGRYRKLTVTVSRTSTGNLWLASVGGGWWQLAGEYEYPLADPAPNAPLGPCYGLPNGDLLALLPGGMLLRFFIDGQKRAVMCLSANALALVGSAAGYGFIWSGADAAPTLVTQYGSSPERVLELWRGYKTVAAAFLANNMQNAARSAVALRFGEKGWRVCHVQWAGETHESPQGRDTAGEVVGIFAHGEALELVTLDIDKRTFRVANTAQEVELTRAGANVVHAIMSVTDPPLLAYTTETGEVAVYSLNHREYVFRFLPQEPTELTQPTLPNLDLPVTDELTGLLTKFAAREKLGTWGLPYTLILFDLDEFGAYNERFGRAAGDNVLREIGEFLKEWTNGTGRVAARVGPDEFMLGLPHEVQTRTANTYAGTLNSTISSRCLKDTDLKISLSLAQCPENGSSIDAILRVLGEGLKHAKAKPSSGPRIYVA